MYRISVTTIEKFRRYMTEASPYDTEASLLETIKGEFKGNEKTRIGGAYHQIIEGTASIVEGGLIADGIFFTAEQAGPALAFKARHKHMIHEIKASRIYETRYGKLMVSGRIDGQEGRESNDIKCTFRRPTEQSYIDSYQWRYYLDMLGNEIFFYDLFQFDGFEAFDDQTLPIMLPGVFIQAHDRLPCHHYQAMNQDCLSMLNDFLDYVDNRQLWSYLKDAADYGDVMDFEDIDIAIQQASE